METDRPIKMNPDPNTPWFLPKSYLFISLLSDLDEPHINLNLEGLVDKVDTYLQLLTWSSLTYYGIGLLVEDLNLLLTALCSIFLS